MSIASKQILKTIHIRPALQNCLWGVWLCALTIGYLIHRGSAIHPVDARNGEQLMYMHLEYPLLNYVAEPFTVLWKVMSHAADFHVAMISYLLWGILVAVILTWLHSKNVLITLRTAMAVGSVIILYDVFMLMMPPTALRLVLDEPGMVIADLHSHSYYSHDSFLEPGENLKIHKDAGFDVVAITDHYNTEGENVEPRLNYIGSTSVLKGVETHDSQDAYLIAVGQKGIEPLSRPLESDVQTREWIRKVHEQHNGVVIAMYINIHPDDIARLMSLGVDAFEISNRGHPGLSRRMRAALNQVNVSGVPLVASSDLHGWGIDIDTWTVFRYAAASSSPENAVLSAIRERRFDDIIPVSSHILGEMTLMDAIVAPFRNLFQYWRELSLSGLLSWWIWAGGLYLTGRIIESRNRLPRRIIFALFLITCGSILLYRGFEVMTLSDIGMGSIKFNNETGMFVCAIGVLSMMAGMFVRRKKVSYTYNLTATGGDNIRPYPPSLESSDTNL